MQNRRWSRAQSIAVFTAIFTVTQIHAADWGRIASGIAGSYAGAYIAERSGGGTAAQITSSIIGSHLAVRAYDSYQKNQRQSYVDNTETNYVEDNGSYEYSYSSSYSSARYTPSVEEITRAYADYRADNTAIFTKAKSDLVAKIKAVQSGGNPSWICAAVCAKFNEYSLVATPLVTSANTAQGAYDQLNKACPAGAVFTDGLAENNKGTQTLALNETHLVCFPNSLSVEQTIENAQANQKMKIRSTTTDIKVTLQNGKAPSRKLIFDLLNELNDPVIEMINSGNATLGDVVKKAEAGDLKEQIDRLSANLGPAKMQSDGSLVMESKEGTAKSQYLRITVRPVSATKVISTTDAPIVNEHKCGTEVGRVTITAVVESGRFDKKPQMTDNLIEMHMQAAGYSAAGKDQFCK